MKSLHARLAALVERPLPLLIAIFAIFLLVYGASLVVMPNRYGRWIVGDGIYYYVYLRSAVLDGDLEFTNDYTLYQQYSGDSERKKEEMLSRKTPTGAAANFFSVGPAVLWAPLYVVAHGLARIVGHASDGFSFWYQAPILFLSIGYGFAGIWLMYRVAAAMFSKLAACVAILGIWLATNVVYYMGVSPSASHVLSMFASALFVFLWWRGRAKRTSRAWFVWGLSAGIMALVRWQDGLIALLALFTWFADVPSIFRLRESATRAHMVSWIFKGSLFCCGAFIAFLPQMIAWNALYGSPLVIPQGSGFLQWFRPEILNVWFSTKRGLFTWSPLLVLAVIGFIPLYQRNKLLGVSTFVIFILETYVNSIVNDWWGGEAFGARRFISLMPFFALGLAAFVDAVRERIKVSERWMQTLLWGGLAAFIIWNNLFVLQYNLWLHGIGHISAVPTLQEMTVDKFTAPFKALQALRGN